MSLHQSGNIRRTANSDIQSSMLYIYFFFASIFQLSYGGYVDDTKFDETLKEIVQTRANADPSFLAKFVNDDGIPKGLGNRAGFNDSHCYKIKEYTLAHSKYADCTKLESVKGSVVDLNLWSGFDIFKFSVNLLELKNVKVEMTYRTELTYLYFSAFRKCDNCLFNFTRNPALVGLRFWHMSNAMKPKDLKERHRPRLFIRGNSRLKLSHGEDTRKIDDLKKVCHKEVCEIQNNEECHFRHSIKSSNEYSSCKYVYGDMRFNFRFQESNPKNMDFQIDGCFVFNRTGIQFLRPIMRAYTNCSRQHIFENNKYMCTDQLDQLGRRWGPSTVKRTADELDVKCYQGECRGGFVSEKVKDRYSGCEVFRGDVYISEKSGNLSDRIRDLSYAHIINGTFQIVNNTSIKKLALPFLNEIVSAKCPALLIDNMPNLRDIIFKSHIVFRCNSTGPKVVIRNSPNVYLYHQILRQMRSSGAVLEDFDTDTDSYSENYTFYLVGLCVLIIIVVEIGWALRRNLLFPNWVYRVFPMSIKRKLKQKQPKRKKEE